LGLIVNDRVNLEREADRLLELHVSRLSAMPPRELVSLPPAKSSEVSVGGRRCSLTLFSQSLAAGTLVTVQLAWPTALGLASLHRERGVVLESNGTIREASADELLLNGG
jgi:hypothetical protein